MKQTGFTLIEIVVALTIVVIIVPALFTLLYSVLRQQSRLSALYEAKRQGDFVLSAMENSIRTSAISVHDGTTPLPGVQICTASGVSVPAAYFQDTLGNWFRFYLSSGKIASESSIIGTSGDLTTTKVRVSNFSVTCRATSTFSTPVVSITFQMEYNTASTRPEDTALLNYQTKVKLRNP